MKNVIIFVAAFIFAAGLFAQDTELIKYVPGDVDGFGQVNIKELAANPKFKDFVETNQDPKFNQFKDSLKLNGIDIYNAFSSGVFYFNSKSKKGGAVLKTSISENATLAARPRTNVGIASARLGPMRALISRPMSRPASDDPKSNVSNGRDRW